MTACAILNEKQIKMINARLILNDGHKNGPLNAFGEKNIIQINTQVMPNLYFKVKCSIFT